MTHSYSLCIHGHFYQPPRENPWTERINRQPSAAPFHDWNARVTHECYACNAWAKVLDGHGDILDISNNYKDISFNFGPTLLAWLKLHRPDVHDAIVRADKLGAAQFSGHGPALAQVYNHMIMPLASARDQHTQILWGIQDFHARFQRRPEGVWLAETAVDSHTLESLARHGIAFTILAPHQAKAIRAPDGAWRTLNHPGELDTSQPYVQKLASGRSIAIFFYDGPTSRAVAFEKLLDNGDRFVQRLKAPQDPSITRAQLGHIATDGESYGHHHTYGEMALAYTLRVIREDESVNLTVYGEFLAAHPPTHEVMIVEDSSWSCAHGIERWRADCGCHTGGHEDGDQTWRAPLRAALDALRDEVYASVEASAVHDFTDPWGARDRYIHVLLQEESLEDFCARESAQPDVPRMQAWMELLRHAMLMYTSCAWFFHDLEGIETIQILRYAGRVMELHDELCSAGVSEAFMTHLSEAKAYSGASGSELFAQHVAPMWPYALAQALVTRQDTDLHEALIAWRAEPTDVVKTRALRLMLGENSADFAGQNQIFKSFIMLQENQEPLKEPLVKELHAMMRAAGFSARLWLDEWC